MEILHKYILRNFRMTPYTIYSLLYIHFVLSWKCSFCTCFNLCNVISSVLLSVWTKFRTEMTIYYSCHNFINAICPWKDFPHILNFMWHLLVFIIENKNKALIYFNFIMQRKDWTNTNNLSCQYSLRQNPWY